MKAEIILTITNGERKKLKSFLDDLKHVTNAKEIKTGKFDVEFV